MARPRSPFAGFLAFLGGTAIALGIVGLWVNRTIGDTEAVSALAPRLLAQDVIVGRLANEIVDPVLAASPPEVRRQRRVIVATTQRVLGDERFVPVFEDVLRDSHRQLLAADEDVTLRLDPALDVVIVEIRRVAPAVADQLETVDAPEPTNLSASQASRVRGVIDFERTASFALVIIGAILVVIAVIGGGPRALVPAGTTLAVLCVLIFVIAFGVRALVGIEVSGASRDAASSAYGVVIGGLRTTLIVAALAGIAAAVTGAVLARRG